MLLKVVIELVDSHSINARSTFVRLDPSKCFLQISSFNDLLHSSFCTSWAFGHTHRLQRFGPFPPRPPGFTCWRGREVQIALDILPHVVIETHVLLASPLVRAFNHRYRLCLSVDSAFRHWSASLALPTSWPNMPSADFCSAVREPRGTPSRRSDTKQISRGKFNRLLRTVAGSTLRVLDGYGLRGKLPARPTLTPCIRFLSIDSRICSTLPSDPASRRWPLRHC